MKKSHSDDETTGVGTIIMPNAKCDGCLHYVANRTLCLKGTVPNACGDGSAPEVGYAPVVTDAAAYQEWRAKRGLAHNAPRSTTPASDDRSGPDLVIQVLGDEGHMDLGKGAGGPKMPWKGGTKSKETSGIPKKKAPVGYSKRLKLMKQKHATASTEYRPGTMKKAATMPMPKLKNPSMKQGYRGEDTDRTQAGVKPAGLHVVGPNPKAGATPVASRAKVDSGGWEPGKTVVGAKVNPAKSPILHEVRRRHMQNPSSASQYKAAQAGGGKVFSHKHLAAHVGMKPEHIADLAHASDHVHDFHNKVRAEFGDKAKNLTSGQIRSAYHSTGLMHSMNPDVSKGLKWAPHPQSGGVKARAPGGGHFHVHLHGTQSKVGLFHKPKLAGMMHIGDFESAGHAKAAAESHGLSSKKALTTMDLDLIKAHKSGKRCVVGHTSSGKPIHSDAHGAEGYTEDEHREAEEIHRDIGERLSDAAHGVTSYGPRGKLPHAARKYLGDIAQKHNLLGRRHGKTAMDHSSARYAKERSATGVLEPQAFLSDAAKSLAVSLSNNPTDADIAKAIEAGGGGEALVESMEVRAPMNVHNPLGGKLVLNKPSSTRTS